MKRNWLRTGTLVLCASLIFSGCGGQQGANETNLGTQNRTYGTQNDANTLGARNYGGATGYNTGHRNGATGFGTGTGAAGYGDGTGWFGTGTGTTGTGWFGNRNGNGIRGFGTGNGVGMMGISSQLESQLNQSGSLGTKVLVIGDTIILGVRNNADNGMQGAGNGTRLGNRGTGFGGIRNDNNENGARGFGLFGNTGNRTGGLGNTGGMLQNRLGAGGRVLTVTDEDALVAMDRVQRSLSTYASSDLDAISSDIVLILSRAQSNKGMNNTRGANGKNRINTGGTTGTHTGTGTR
jgi:hypothetical protein